MAAVGMVTGAFLDNLLGVSARAETPLTSSVTVALFVGCTALLWVGKFNALDKVIKLLAGVLLVSTVTAVALTVASPHQPPRRHWPNGTGPRPTDSPLSLR